MKEGTGTGLTTLGTVPGEERPRNECDWKKNKECIVFEKGSNPRNMDTRGSNKIQRWNLRRLYKTAVRTEKNEEE